MKNFTFELRVTAKERELLVIAVESYKDSGPQWDRWQSEEMKLLVTKVKEAKLSNEN